MARALTFDDVPLHYLKGRALMAAKKRRSTAHKGHARKATKRRLPPRHKTGPKKGQFKKRR